MEKERQLEQELLELKTRFAELAKVCDNLIERVQILESDAGKDGVFLQGVDEYYRDVITKTMNSEKR